MMGQLVTLPLRLTVRTASLFLRGSDEVIKRALALTGRTVEAEPRYETGAAPTTVRDNGYRTETRPRPARAERQEQTAADRSESAEQAEAPATEQRAEQRPSPPSPPEPSTPQEPTHVSEEPVIVEERADPGAEDGAGAEVHIEEPWSGYARMNAKEVIARLAAADSAELAAVSLYESANRARQTVLSAVERQLQLASRGGTSP